MDNTDENIYVVYRIHHDYDRRSFYGASAVYGWSNDKDVVKAFIKQRDKKKYKVIKYTQEELAEEFSEFPLEYDNVIDCIKLKSVTTGGYIYMLMTAFEAGEAELKVRKLFIDASSFASFNSNKYLEMFINLDEKYDEALYFIGFRPPEIDALYDSADIRDGNDYQSAEDLINSVYSNITSKEIPLSRSALLPGAWASVDLFPKLINSLESFIKVLKDEM